MRGGEGRGGEEEKDEGEKKETFRHRCYKFVINFSIDNVRNNKEGEGPQGY